MFLELALSNESSRRSQGTPDVRWGGGRGGDVHGLALLVGRDIGAE